MRPPGWQLAARAAKNRHVKNEDLVRDRMPAVCILRVQMPNLNSPERNARPTTLRRASKANQSTLHAVLTPPPRGPPGDPHVLPRTSGTNGGPPMCTNANARRAVTFAVCYAPHRQLWIRQSSPAPPGRAPGSVVSMCGSRREGSTRGSTRESRREWGGGGGREQGGHGRRSRTAQRVEGTPGVRGLAQGDGLERHGQGRATAVPKRDNNVCVRSCGAA